MPFPDQEFYAVRDECERLRAENERLLATIEVMRGRAKNLDVLLQCAALDARNIGARGFFESLTPAQQKAALEYRGPENHGDDRWKIRG